jgi:hypothetical protein
MVPDALDAAQVSAPVASRHSASSAHEDNLSVTPQRHDRTLLFSRPCALRALHHFGLGLVLI